MVARSCRAACRDIAARGKRPLFVGGTPFYLKALSSRPLPRPARRRRLRRTLEAEAERRRRRGPARAARGGRSEDRGPASPERCAPSGAGTGSPRPHRPADFVVAATWDTPAFADDPPRSPRPPRSRPWCWNCRASSSTTGSTAGSIRCSRPAGWTKCGACANCPSRSAAKPGKRWVIASLLARSRWGGSRLGRTRWNSSARTPVSSPNGN